MSGLRRKYRVGIIGGGRKGTSRARVRPQSFDGGCRHSGSDPENLELFRGRFNVPGYSDYKEMLENERIDIAAPILPVTPNPAVVIGCAEAGVKAILCEKPLAATLEDADRMVQACQSRGIKFGAGDMDRNLPAYWKAKEIIDSGELARCAASRFPVEAGQSCLEAAASCSA